MNFIELARWFWLQVREQTNMFGHIHSGNGCDTGFVAFSEDDATLLHRLRYQCEFYWIVTPDIIPI